LENWNNWENGNKNTLLFSLPNLELFQKKLEELPKIGIFQKIFRI